MIALAATVFLGGCAERKLGPAEAEPALINQAAEPAVSTPEVANPAIPAPPIAADQAVGSPESARPAVRPAAAPAPLRLRVPGIAVGEPDPTHRASATADTNQRVQSDNTAATGKSLPDTNCRTDSDCAIKDVGSCCGFRPQCLNKNTQTFPEQVQARCGQEGRMGICGFPSISGCQCVAGKCSGIASSGDSTQVQ